MANFTTWGWRFFSVLMLVLVLAQTAMPTAVYAKGGHGSPPGSGTHFGGSAYPMQQRGGYVSGGAGTVTTPYYYGTGYSYPYYSYASPYYGYSAPAYGYSTGTVTQGPTTSYTVPVQGRYLGIDEVAVVDGVTQGMQVMRVFPGSPAERAGLQVGDVIHTANGYQIQQHGNLTWIISSLPANGILQMSVRTARDGMEHTISAQIP